MLVSEGAVLLLSSQTESQKGMELAGVVVRACRPSTLGS